MFKHFLSFETTAMSSYVQFAKQINLKSHLALESELFIDLTSCLGYIMV